MGAVHHLENFVVVDAVLEVLGNFLELLEVDNSILVLVEELEDSLEAVLGLALADLAGGNVDKLVKTDGLALFFEAIDDPEDVGAPPVDSELFKDLIDFGRVDCAAAILVKDLKGLFQLVVVLGRESVFPLGGDCFHDLGRASLGFCCSAHNIFT